MTHPASGIEETDHSINQHLLLTIQVVALGSGESSCSLLLAAHEVVLGSSN